MERLAFTGPPSRLSSRELLCPLKDRKVQLPVLTIGGDEALGAKVANMVQSLAKHVTGKVIPGCSHFIPEEKHAEFARLFREFVGKVG